MLNRRTILTVMISAGMTAALAACASSPAPDTAGPDTGASGDPSITHVHAVARDGKTGQVVIATHEGAYLRVSGEWVAQGPEVDLMSFAVAPDGTWFASGHPAANVDLPQPVGLISSTDSGQTWTVESRGGESDFHALAAGPDGIVGFDGTLRSTTDRRTWTDLTIPAAAHSLAISPRSGTILATTEQGLLRSEDRGQSWSRLQPPGLVALVAWADDENAVGVTTEGVLVTSADSGATWEATSTPLPEVTALSASVLPTGQLEILVVSGTSVLVSTDGGKTTTALQ